MKNSIIIQIFSVLIISISCQEVKEKQILADEKTVDSTVVNPSIKKNPATLEQRISDIKTWYDEAQKSRATTSKHCKNNEENCTSFSKFSV